MTIDPIRHARDILEAALRGRPWPAPWLSRHHLSTRDQEALVSVAEALDEMWHDLDMLATQFRSWDYVALVGDLTDEDAKAAWSGLVRVLLHVTEGSKQP